MVRASLKLAQQIPWAPRPALQMSLRASRKPQGRIPAPDPAEMRPQTRHCPPLASSEDHRPSLGLERRGLAGSHSPVFPTLQTTGGLSIFPFQETKPPKGRDQSHWTPGRKGPEEGVARTSLPPQASTGTRRLR